MRCIFSAVRNIDIRYRWVQYNIDIRYCQGRGGGRGAALCQSVKLPRRKGRNHACNLANLGIQWKRETRKHKAGRGRAL